jgi:hypothetical protein
MKALHVKSDMIQILFRSPYLDNAVALWPNYTGAPPGEILASALQVVRGRKNGLKKLKLVTLNQLHARSYVATYYI